MKALISWSGGKDSALALYYARQQNINIQALLTSVNHVHDRISMHGVRRSLLEQQAASLQLPLHTIELSEQPGMDEYEEAVNTSYNLFKKDGFSHAIFGDIFLEDLKIYRESQLAKQNIQSIFPIWKIDSSELINEFISLGFKAIIVCVNTKFLDKSFCGRLINDSFVRDLPGFESPIRFETGEIVYKEYKTPADGDKECYTTPQPPTGFYFIDLLPAVEEIK